MTIIKRVLWGFLALLTLAWWVTDRPVWSELTNYFAWRTVLVQYTGVLAIGVMSLAVILSARPALLERHLDGLDKMYRLHKWLGISALVLSVVHWLLAKGTKWAVGFGWLERPARGNAPPGPELQGTEALFRGLRGFAESVGEWTFYIAAMLMVLALLRRFPYRPFLQTHRLLALVYLVLVFHSVVLLRFDSWSGPSGVLMAVLMGLGSVAAVMSLLGRRAGGTRVQGRVEALETQAEAGTVQVDIRLAAGWRGHRAGQFAFLTLEPREGAHPFTIASAWRDDGHIRFIIKGLGDYTNGLPERLKVGDAVAVEGPYGCFDFSGAAQRQIWIGAGIGITPFIARLEALADQRDGRRIDLFHTARQMDAASVERLGRAAEAAGVDLHLLCSGRNERLDARGLMARVPDWREADVWFCGPSAFGRSLKQALCAQGLPAARFHQELFEMR